MDHVGITIDHASTASADYERLPDPARLKRVMSLHKNNAACMGFPDLVTFAHSSYLATENTPEVALYVHLAGAGQSTIRVHWVTENKTLPPEAYQEQKGTLIFQPGEHQAQITIKILEDDFWNGEALQVVHLRVDPQDSSKAVIGDLAYAEVSILNNDLYPSGVEPSVSRFTMLVAFFRQNIQPFRSELKWGLLYKSYPAVDFVVIQVCILLAMNLAIAQKKDWLLGIFCVILLVNYGVAHFCSCQFRKLRLGGKSYKTLRTCVFDQSLRLSPEHSNSLQAGKITALMSFDVPLAIQQSFLSIFTLYQEMLSSLALITFTLIVVLQRSEIPWYLRLCLVAAPLLIIAWCSFFMLRNIGDQCRLTDKALGAYEVLGTFVEEKTTLRTLSINYNQTLPTAQEFGKKHAAFNNAAFQADYNKAEFIWRARWFNMFIISGIMFAAGYLAIKEIIQLGTFVTLVGSMQKFDATIKNIFQNLFNIGEAYSPVMKIAAHLNCKRYGAFQLGLQEHKSRLIQEALDKHEIETIPPCTLMLHNVSYSYSDKNILAPLSLQVESGRVVTLRSPAATGKTTLLKIIANQLQPTEGWSRVPGDWFTRLLGVHPQIIDTSLMTNLRYGNRWTHPDSEIWDLCRQVGLSDSLISGGDKPVGPAGCKLAQTDQMLVAICRALLSSPDLLLLAGSLDSFSQEQGERLMRVFREFVRYRGLPVLKSEMARFPLVHRKPKLILVATRRAEFLGLGDMELDFREEGNMEADADVVRRDSLSMYSPSAHGMEYGVPAIQGHLGMMSVMAQSSRDPSPYLVSDELGRRCSGVNLHKTVSISEEVTHMPRKSLEANPNVDSKDFALIFDGIPIPDTPDAMAPQGLHPQTNGNKDQSTDGWPKGN